MVVWLFGYNGVHLVEAVVVISSEANSLKARKKCSPMGELPNKYKNQYQ